MKTVEEAWGAGESKRFVVPGRYFHLLATTSPVNVEFFENGRILSEEKATGVEAGYFALPPRGFTELVLTSALAQTIKFAITGGSGGYNRSFGSVDVLDDVARQLGIARIVDANGNAFYSQPVNGASFLESRILLGRDVGFAYGSSFASNTALAANTNENPVAPAANVNGLLVWHLWATAAAAAGSVGSFLAKASAPATVIDGEALGGMSLPGPSRLHTPRSLIIVTGKGLYYRSGAAAEAANQSLRGLLYTLL